MELFGRDLDRDIAFIAEAGVNHEGDPEAALKLVRLAAEAGADAVKFQTYTPERFASASDPARLERVKRFSLSEETHRRLADEARKCGIAFFSSAITEDVVPLLAELGEAIKIASGDIDFEPVIRAAASSGRKAILSTGLATLEEVDRAVDWFKDETGLADVSDRLVLMQCICAYPAPLEEANARGVPFMAERYGLKVGYSNHVIGPDACYAAIALGAPVIEVHFTDAREGREFRDHQLSMLPDEMRDLIRHGRAIRSALGTFGKERTACELGNYPVVRKGVVAARDLPEGHVIGEGDLMYARPATEFFSGEASSLLGKRLSRSIAAGELIPRDATG